MQCIYIYNYIYIIYAWIYNCCPSFNIASSLETSGPTSSAHQPLKDGNSARRHVTYSAWRSWLLALGVCEWLRGHLEETTHMNCLHMYIYIILLLIHIYISFIFIYYTQYSHIHETWTYNDVYIIIYLCLCILGPLRAVLSVHLCLDKVR
jgi:uncharacterized protein YggT (Ycf19 family)